MTLPNLALASSTLREKAWWAALLAVALAQLVAFWMVCHQQVRRAEVREAGLQVQRMAFADCGGGAGRATLRGCAGRNEMPPNGSMDATAMAAAWR
jgi:hypothetical protein